MHSPNTKIPKDIRHSLTELFDPRGLLGAKMTELFGAARREVNAAFLTVKSGVTDRISREWTETQQRLERMGYILDHMIHLRLEALAKDFEPKNPHKQLASFPLISFMEPPKFIECCKRFSGEPVYFVNGIWTSEKKARAAATELGRHLRRRICVVYNPSIVNRLESRTSGAPAIRTDILGAAYDTVWPLLTCTVPPRQLAALGQGSVQANVAARQITHLLFHANKPVSIVSHSQGCIIVRNACFALFLLGKEKWVQEQLAWVATGLPLDINEVWPRPNRYTSLVDENDPVAKIWRFNDLSNIGTALIRFHHSFVGHYIQRIDPDDLW